MDRDEPAGRVYVVRREYVEGQVFHQELDSSVFSSYDRAVEYLKAELTDEDKEKVLITISEYAVDSGMHWAIQVWEFTGTGVLVDCYGCDDDEEDEESEIGDNPCRGESRSAPAYTGRFAPGDLVKILPRRENPDSPCHVATIGVVVELPDEERPELEYFVQYVNELNGFLWDFRISEELLAPLQEELRPELRILAVISEHLRGIHPLEPEVVELLFSPCHFVKNVTTFDFERKRFVVPKTEGIDAAE